MELYLFLVYLYNKHVVQLDVVKFTYSDSNYLKQLTKAVSNQITQ